MRLELWITGQEASLEEILDGRERKKSILWEDFLTLTYWIDGEEKFPDRSWDFRKESVSSAAALLFCAAVPGSTVQKKFSTGRSG